VAAFALIYGPSLLSHASRSFSGKYINDDVRQQIFPFFSFEDKALFRNDYIAQYYFDILPVFYRGIYILSACFGGVVALSQALPYLLLAVVVIATGAAAKRLAGNAAAATAATLILGHQYFLQRMAGGLPRGFAFPVIAILLWSLASGNALALSVLTCLAAGFYPVVSVIAGSCLVGWLLLLPAHWRGQASSWSVRRRLLTIAATFTSAVMVLAPQSLSMTKYGVIISVTRLFDYPEIGPGGRYTPEDRAPFPELLDAVRESLERSLSGSGKPLSFDLRTWASEVFGLNLRQLTLLAVSAAAVTVFLALPKRRELLRIALLPMSIACGYVLSARHAPHLFLPQRYVVYAVPLLSILLVSTAPGLLFERFSRITLCARSGLAGCACLLAVCMFGGYGSPTAGLGTPTHAESGVMVAIGRLGKDALIAAWPDGIANDIPYVVRRRVLVTAETHQAFHENYTLQMRRRVEALIDAYAASDIAPLLRLHREFGVTHFWFDGEFANGNMPRYFRPFDVTIGMAARRLGRRPPIALTVAASSAVYRNRTGVLIDLVELSKSDKAKDGLGAVITEP